MEVGECRVVVFCFVELFRLPTFLLGSLTPRPSLHTQQCPVPLSTTAAVSMKVIKRNFPLLTPHGIRRKKMNIWQWWLLVKGQSFRRNMTTVFGLFFWIWLKNWSIHTFKHSSIRIFTQARILDVGEFFLKKFIRFPLILVLGGGFSPDFFLPPPQMVPNYCSRSRFN